MGEEARKKMLKFIVTIVNRDKGRNVVEFYKHEKIHTQFVTVGFGTASSEIMDMLGLGDSDKIVIFSLAPGFRINQIFEDLNQKLHFHMPGKGIAFTIPITGVNNLISMLNQDMQNRLEGELKNMEHATTENALIFTVVNQGYTDDLMETAHKAGARGGTILHARGVGSEEAEKFLGITMQEEREIVMIVVPRDKKRAIMQAICENHGLKTEAGGIVISLPVEDMAGM